MGPKEKWLRPLGPHQAGHDTPSRKSLRRKKLVLDNGAAYRAASLQGICARLEIRLVYCRPFSPQAKGKLERWHRTCRNRFLTELDLREARDLQDLNARLWAWIETLYHQTVHSALSGLPPLQR